MTSASVEDFNSPVFENYLAVILLTVGVYDYSLTFGDEVRDIWRKKMKLPDFLLILIRYCAIFLSVMNLSLTLHAAFESLRLRKLLAVIQVVGNAIAISAADCILAMRIWVLYGRNYPILSFLLFLIAFQTVYLTMVIKLFSVHTTTDRYTIWTQFPLITSVDLPRLVLEYLPNTLTAATMFCLSSGRCIWSIYQSDSRYMPLTKMFLRGGVLWFLCAFVALIIQVALLSLPNPFLYAPGSRIIAVTYSIVSSRVLIGMRALDAKQDEILQIRQLTTLEF